MAIIIILYLAVIVLMLVSMWKLYQKLGAQGWEFIVPIYNIIVLMQRVGWNPIRVLWYLVPIANVVVMVMLWHAVSLKFGKGVGYTLGLIFLPIIFVPLLAFKGEVVTEEAAQG